MVVIAVDIPRVSLGWGSSSPCWEGLWAVWQCHNGYKKHHQTGFICRSRTETLLLGHSRAENQQKTGLASPTQRANAHVQRQSKSKERHSCLHSCHLGKWKALSLSISQCGGCTGSMWGFGISVLESPVTGRTRFSIIFCARATSSNAHKCCRRRNKKIK